jgi:ubiquinone/menaquinone biosynthesis C-methylase UbiE
LGDAFVYTFFKNNLINLFNVSKLRYCGALVARLKAEQKPEIREFNLRAASYENSRKQSIIFDRVQKAVLELTEKDEPKAILDIGCGTGRLLRKAQQRWPEAEIIGVDPAENMIEQAKQLFPQGKFYVAMAESLPLPDKSVDIAFSTLSYHHWLNQDQAVAEINRVLRSDGKFLLADIVMPRGLSFILRHTKRNNKKRIQQTFAKAGLNVELQQRRLLLVVITVRKKPKLR